MTLRRRDLIVLGLGALIVATGVVLALLGEPPPQGLGTDAFQSGPSNDPEEEEGPPSLIRFKGDLARGVLFRNKHQVHPFVVGEILELDVEARNVAEFRWVCNGKVVAIEGHEWTVRRSREFDLTQPGTYHFRVDARGKDDHRPVRPLEKKVEVLSLKILEFEAITDPLADRYLTGSQIQLQVDMVEPLQEVTYVFQYKVNGKSVLNPENSSEWNMAHPGSTWSDSDIFTYDFKKQGRFLFQVEARRTDRKDAEDVFQMPHAIGVGDSVIDYLYAFPENANIGTEVVLQAFVQSKSMKAQVRFGLKDLRPGKDYVWIKNGKGKDWGSSERRWVPQQAGNFRLRAEIRPGKDQAVSDFREMLYVVTKGTPEF